MKYFGAHVSACGRCRTTHPANAHAIGATAFALFTKNQRQWSAPSALTAGADRRLSARRATTYGYRPEQILPHDSYLINLGHPDDRGAGESRAQRFSMRRWQRCETAGTRPSELPSRQPPAKNHRGGEPRPDRRVDQHRPRQDPRGDGRDREHRRAGVEPRISGSNTSAI